MPYQCIPLFLSPDWSGSSKPKKFIQVGGILRSGIVSGAYLKAKIKISDDAEEGSSDDEFDEEDDEFGEKRKTLDKNLAQNEEEKSKAKHEIINHLL